MTDLIVYGTPVSPFVRKVEAVLRHQRVDYERLDLNAGVFGFFSAFCGPK